MTKSGYRSIEKKHRNENLIKYWQSHPGITCRALGGIFKLSYQRVHAILKKYQETTCLNSEA